MRVPFCTTIKDDTLGIETIWDFECELEVEGYEVWDVFKDGKRLYNGTRFSQALAAEVIDAAETDIRNRGWLWNRIGELLMDQALSYDRAASAADRRNDMVKEGAW